MSFIHWIQLIYVRTKTIELSDSHDLSFYQFTQQLQFRGCFVEMKIYITSLIYNYAA